MAHVFEAIMVILFGVSWPTSIIKSFKSRTAKGKSILFLFLIWLGYVSGIAFKLCSVKISYVIVFYCLNLVMVSADIILYFRNKKLDRTEESRGKKAAG